MKMGLSLDDLAMKKPFKPGSEFQNFFNALDNVCTSNDHGYTCESFNYMEVDETFKSIMVKALNILKRSTKEENIYTKDITPKQDSCLYYKYWFYYKILSDTTGNIDITKIKNTWRKNQSSIYPFPSVPCKFHANTMEDVKILKVLYDHIFFSNRTEDKYNLIKEIHKCEFCKYLKNYIEKIFTQKTITCNNMSPYAICMEYNDHFNKIINLVELSSLACGNGEDMSHCPSYSKVEEAYRERVSLGVVREESLPRIQENDKPQDFSQNPEEKNLSVQNIIGGVSVLGISSILFLLYKYTSFGHLVRSRTRWIKDTERTPQEIDNEILLLDDSETYHINSDNPQYNIAYNTVQD
ncbi:PIR Superfamily Protein [Plasmodium ovale wallikeri]|uniref:PIR proteine n=2 Tax=Plasmodium ovale TaxID=36330 RepID=A0A1C3KKB0_PLAOA|nr:PIR Superfamily Protein [Plasmodium ovale wallikeri]SBT74319.1 PIR proteine [Plasmodium ovale]